jgi:ubiquinone/menaquinone biosynthesis C-methylase UbiE
VAKEIISNKIFSGKPEELKSVRRKKFLPIEIFENEVIKNLVYKNICVDYGAGIGYFTIPLAKWFKKVFAIECNNLMAKKLKKEIEDVDLSNIEVIVSCVPPKFVSGTDFILFSNILHEVDDYNKLLSWSKKSKVVCVIEWKKKETEFGPPIEHRIDKNLLKEKLKKYFKFVKEINLYPYHYVLLGYHDEKNLIMVD